MADGSGSLCLRHELGPTFAALADGLRDEGVTAEVVLLIVSRADVGAARQSSGSRVA